MTRYCFVNHRFLPHHLAHVIHIEDRGFQLADGVYEVVGYLQGKPIDMDWHLQRLQSSLEKLEIEAPMPMHLIQFKMRQLMAKNHFHEGLVYIQITRGVAPRNHIYPDPAPPASLVITTKSANLLEEKKFSEGVNAITMPELRWQRCDIKTIGLTANCMAREQAKKQQAAEAIFIDEAGNVIEGAASTLWMISQDHKLITHPVGDGRILPGISRRRLLDLLQTSNLQFEERSFTLEEAYQAKELFFTAASSLLVPIIRLDDKEISDGKPGSLTEALRQDYIDFILNHRDETA